VNTPNNCAVGEFIAAPGPAIRSIIPDYGVQGISSTIIIVGARTHFSKSTTVTFSGSGITVRSVNLWKMKSGENNITVDITISETATPGVRDVTVTTPLESGKNEVVKGRIEVIESD
jgi:hypothetical protein